MFNCFKNSKSSFKPFVNTEIQIFYILSYSTVYQSFQNIDQLKIHADIFTMDSFKIH